MKVLACAVIGLVAATGTASAQATWAYRGRMAFETGLLQTNRSSPVAEPGGRDWHESALFAASADASVDLGSRIKLAGGGVATASDSGGLDVRAREAYARVSASSWMDVEAGKRLVRWGVGYGFAPTGVLDPPRNPTDPNDRLGRNEGRALTRVDLFRGPASLTLAAASSSDSSSLAAVRLRTVAGGVEMALIGTASEGRRPGYGGNLTHVIGDRLEWHAELMVDDEVRAAAGAQYTFGAGVNVVVEYHRTGRRQSSVFLRAVRADTERVIVPELIVIANLNDGGWTMVPAVTWTAHRRLQLYARATRLAGGARSPAAFSPWSTSVTLGAAARF